MRAEEKEVTISVVRVYVCETCYYFRRYRPTTNYAHLLVYERIELFKQP